MENKKTYSIKSNKNIVITIEGEELGFNDGFHDLDEIYLHRCELFINYLNLIDKIKTKLDLTVEQDRQLFIWKQLCYNEDKTFNGWFILGIGLDKGQQISYHLPEKDMDKCLFATDLDSFKLVGVYHLYRYEFDGHTSKDVLDRLENLMQDLNYLLGERFKNE